jgi:hypothetical protein
MSEHISNSMTFDRIHSQALHSSTPSFSSAVSIQASVHHSLSQILPLPNEGRKEVEYRRGPNKEQPGPVLHTSIIVCYGYRHPYTISQTEYPVRHLPS